MERGDNCMEYWDVNSHTKVMSRTMDVLKNFMEDTVNFCLFGGA